MSQQQQQQRQDKRRQSGSSSASDHHSPVCVCVCVCVRERERDRERERESARASENVDACLCGRLQSLGALQMSVLAQTLCTHILITLPKHSNLLLNILASQAPPAGGLQRGWPSTLLPHPASPAWQKSGKVSPVVSLYCYKYKLLTFENFGQPRSMSLLPRIVLSFILYKCTAVRFENFDHPHTMHEMYPRPRVLLFSLYT